MLATLPSFHEGGSAKRYGSVMLILPARIACAPTLLASAFQHVRKAIMLDSVSLAHRCLALSDNKFDKVIHSCRREICAHIGGLALAGWQG